MLDASAGDDANASAKQAIAVRSTSLSPPERTRAAINPRTTRTANKSGAPGVVVTEAAIQSDNKPAATHRTRRGVEPGGISPQVAGPRVQPRNAPVRPPTTRAIAPIGWPLPHARTANPIVTTARPSASPRRASARTMSAAPSHTTRAAPTSITWLLQMQGRQVRQATAGVGPPPQPSRGLAD